VDASQTVAAPARSIKVWVYGMDYVLSNLIPSTVVQVPLSLPLGASMPPQNDEWDNLMKNLSEAETKEGWKENLTYRALIVTCYGWKGRIDSFTTILNLSTGDNLFSFWKSNCKRIRQSWARYTLSYTSSSSSCEDNDRRGRCTGWAYSIVATSARVARRRE
jgi:hypothetical protein